MRWSPLLTLLIVAGCGEDPIGPPPPPPPPEGLVTVRVTAIVTSVRDAYLSYCLGGLIVVGESLTGTYTYDAQAEDSDEADNSAEYHMHAAPYSMSFTDGSFVFKASEPLDIRLTIANGDGVSGPDRYSVSSVTNAAISCGYVDAIAVALEDASGSAINQATLTERAPALRDWTGPNTLLIHGGSLAGTFEIQGRITRIE